MAHDIILYRQKNKTDEWARLARSPYGDSLFLEPAFEISLVFGRSLMEFLGIKYDHKNQQLKELDPNRLGSDDITLKSLFPQRAYCTLHDCDLIKHKADIAILFKVANKSVAHLTSNLQMNRSMPVFQRQEKRYMIYFSNTYRKYIKMKYGIIRKLSHWKYATLNKKALRN